MCYTITEFLVLVLIIYLILHNFYLILRSDDGRIHPLKLDMNDISNDIMNDIVKNLLSNDLVLIVWCLHQLTPCLRIVVKCKHRFTLSHTQV